MGIVRDIEFEVSLHRECSVTYSTSMLFSLAALRTLKFTPAHNQVGTEMKGKRQLRL